MMRLFRFCPIELDDNDNDVICVVNFVIVIRT